MTTYAPTPTPIGQTGDADFRAWIVEYDAACIAAGLVQTSDTGQINVVTVTRPGAGSTSAGYKMYRMNDALQATAPIFIKIEFGTGGAVTAPATWITVGSATNGAGTITASSTSRIFCTRNTSPASTIIPYVTRACGVEGCVWLVFKYQAAAANIPFLGFLLARTSDAAGAPSADGFAIYAINNGPTSAAQQVLFAGPWVSAFTTAFCQVTFGYTSGVVGTDLQYRKHYTANPRERVNPHLLTISINDVAEGTQKVLTPVGTTAHNYICIACGLGHTTGTGAAANNGLMAVWE